jgi:hypothetical protein
MLLYIDTDNDPKTGWLGYDVVINRSNVRPRATTLERNTAAGKYEWHASAEIEYRVSANELELRIPRAVLGLTKLPATLDFKWSDNSQQTGEAADFTLSGDSAPNDRFNYRAILK